jgi:C-terminal processing protease CtpA/Prc
LIRPSTSTSTALALALAAFACDAHRAAAPAPAPALPTLAGASAGWRATTTGPAAADVAITEEADGVRIASAGTYPVGIERALPLAGLRGQRVTIRLEARAVGDGVKVGAAIRTRRPDGAGSYVGEAEAPPFAAADWTPIELTADVEPDAAEMVLSLGVRGAGAGVFRSLSIDAVPASAARVLARDEVDRLMTLARVLALVRYFHPSDPVAHLDWNAFASTAVGAVLAKPSDPLASALRSLLAAVAPTVTIVGPGERVATAERARPAGATHLARWVHFGLGTPDSKWSRSVRDGIVGPGGDGASIIVFRRFVDERIRDCPTLRIRAAPAERSRPDDAVLLWARGELRGGSGEPQETPLVGDAASAVELAVAPVPDPGAIAVGIRFSGAGSIRVADPTIYCGDQAIMPVFAGAASVVEVYGEATFLYEHEVTAGPAPHLVVRRRPFATTLDPAVHVHEADVGAGLRVRVPLALWTDGRRTWPLPAAPPPHVIARSPGDPNVRIAAALLAWGAVRYFWAYYPDHGAGWDEQLRRSLPAIAAAAEGSTFHRALREMMAAAADSHVGAQHRADRPFAMPLVLRWIEGKLLVTATSRGLAGELQPGDELVAIDGWPTASSVPAMMRETAASSPGWSAYAAERKLARGDSTRLRRLDVRRPGESGVRTVYAPSLPRDEVTVQEVRPATGSELRPGVFYVDLTALTPEQWAALQPRLTTARGFVFDLRGYLTKTTFLALAALHRERMRSPSWHIPIRTSPSDAALTYHVRSWETLPPAAVVSGRMVFLIDGRAGSAPETVLQIVRAYRLAELVGEPTCGTNGNRLDVPMPGGFTISFSALRDIDHDGSVFQGHPIQPTVLVRPTQAGIAAGRDEVLEAGLARFGVDESPTGPTVAR